MEDFVMVDSGVAGKPHGIAHIASTSLAACISQKPRPAECSVRVRWLGRFDELPDLPREFVSKVCCFKAPVIPK